MSELTDAVRASGIFPSHAVITESEYVSIDPLGPYAGVEATINETGVLYASYRGLDLTDEYKAWLEDQPRIRQVAIVWPRDA